MIETAPVPTLPVDVAALDRIEDRLYELECGIGALKEVLRAWIGKDHLPFIPGTLVDFLSECLTGCFDAME